MTRVLGSLFIALTLLFQVTLSAQDSKQKGKSHVLEGKVEAVGPDRLTVNHGKVEGFMDAMTMPYKVDKPDILKKVKAGDRIQATVYDGDYTLYDIRVVPAQQKAKSK